MKQKLLQRLTLFGHMSHKQPSLNALFFVIYCLYLSISDIQHQVSAIGQSYEQYSHLFIEYSVTGSVIHFLSLEQLSELMNHMGISTAHRIVIEAHIETWKSFAAESFDCKDFFLHTKSADDIADQV